MAKTAQNHIMSPQAMYFWPKNGQKRQNKNFPRHNTAIKWFKATVPSFWPSFRQIWCAISKKMSESLIFERKWPNFGPKMGPKMAPIFFFRTKDFHLPFLNNKLSFNNNKPAMLRSLGGGQIIKKHKKRRRAISKL